jgi:tRNA (cytidine/uridine-2'-O-)-methyltransferase
MRIALYQPEIAGNVGAVLRLAACFGVPVDIIEPTGFVFSDSKLRRAGMDYIDHVEFVRHADWNAFYTASPGRLVLMTTKGAQSLYDTVFAPDDTVLLGSESAGVPDHVAAACALRVRIPLRTAMRSLNLSVACGITIAEGLRQTGELP